LGPRLLDLPGVLDGVEGFCRARLLSAETALDVRLVAEEVLSNVVKYGQIASNDRIELRVAVSPDAVRMECRDTGPPFNPLDVRRPDLASRPEDRGTGGLGVHLVKSLVDVASYAREGDANVLVLTKHVRSTV